MPMYEPDGDFIDPDSVPRPVVAVGAAIVTDVGGMELSPHHHRKAELLYTTRGVPDVRDAAGLVDRAIGVRRLDTRRHTAQR